MAQTQRLFKKLPDVQKHSFRPQKSAQNRSQAKEKSNAQQTAAHLVKLKTPEPNSVRTESKLSQIKTFRSQTPADDGAKDKTSHADPKASPTAQDWDHLLEQCQQEAAKYDLELKRLRSETSSTHSLHKDDIDAQTVTTTTSNSLSALKKKEDGQSQHSTGSQLILKQQPAETTQFFSVHEKEQIAAVIDEIDKQEKLLPQKVMHAAPDLKQLEKAAAQHLGLISSHSQQTLATSVPLSGPVAPYATDSSISEISKQRSFLSLPTHGRTKPSQTAQELQAHVERLESENQKLHYDHVKALEELATAQEKISDFNRRLMSEMPKTASLEPMDLRLRVSRLNLELSSLHEQNDLLRRDNRRLIEESLSLKHVMENQREIYTNNRLTDKKREQLGGALKRHLDLIEHRQQALSDVQTVLDLQGRRALEVNDSRLSQLLLQLQSQIQQEDPKKAILIFSCLADSMEEVMSIHTELVEGFLEAYQQVKDLKISALEDRKRDESAISDLLHAKDQTIESLKQERNTDTKMSTKYQRTLHALELQLAAKEAELKSTQEELNRMTDTYQQHTNELKGMIAKRDKDLEEKHKELLRIAQKQKSDSMNQLSRGRSRAASEKSLALPDPQQMVQTEMLRQQLADVELFAQGLQGQIQEYQSAIEAWQAENTSLRTMLRGAGQPTPEPMMVQNMKAPPVPIDSLMVELEDATRKVQHLESSLEIESRNNARLASLVETLEKQLHALELLSRQPSPLPPREESESPTREDVQPPALQLSPEPQPFIPPQQTSFMQVPQQPHVLQQHPVQPIILQTPPPQIIMQPQSQQIPYQLPSPVPNNYHDESRTIKDLEKRLKNFQNRLDQQQQDQPLQAMLDRLLQQPLREREPEQDAHHVETLIQQWQTTLKLNDNAVGLMVEKQIEALIERAKELKEERDELVKVNTSLNQQLEIRTLSTREELGLMEARCGEVENALKALRIVLACYERQFGEVLSLSQAPKDVGIDPLAQDTLELIRDAERDLPSGHRHPLPFMHHFQHAVALYSSTHHALEHARSTVTSTRERINDLEKSQLAATDEMKHQYEQNEVLRREKAESEKQLQLLQKAAEQVRQQYEQVAEQNVVLESKLNRIGKGYERIMCS